MRGVGAFILHDGGALSGGLVRRDPVMAAAGTGDSSALNLAAPSQMGSARCMGPSRPVRGGGRQPDGGGGGCLRRWIIAAAKVQGAG
jgi:hypothetical protein